MVGIWPNTAFCEVTRCSGRITHPTEKGLARALADPPPYGLPTTRDKTILISYKAASGRPRAILAILSEEDLWYDYARRWLYFLFHAP